ncbi:MAG: M20 metallopeptidase family protein [Bacteroidales bacterium]
MKLSNLSSPADTIRNLAMKYREEILFHRRYFHQFPELSFEEKGTAEYIAHFLESHHIPFRKGFAGYGLVATLAGKREKGRVIALRADMDALPVKEKTGLPFASRHTGRMHACGHDMHMASLMGTLLILKDIRDSWEGRVLFVFQPGEEKLPGGALSMIKEGALSEPAPELIMAQHVLPEMATGHVGFRPGKYMASSDELYLTVRGKGGHAAMLKETVNPLMIAARLLVLLDQKIRQETPGNTPTVLSFGKITGAGATNVVPDEVKLDGTFRTLDESWREKAHRLIRETARSVASQMGGACETTIVKGYPVLENHLEMTRRAMKYAAAYLGNENVEELDIRMTAEDFAHYARQFPAVFYRLGTGDGNPPAGGLHSPEFTAREEALTTGSGTMAWLAYSFLHDATSR